MADGSRVTGKGLLYFERRMESVLLLLFSSVIERREEHGGVRSTDEFSEAGHCIFLVCLEGRIIYICVGMSKNDV